MKKQRNDTDLQSLPSIGPSLEKCLKDLGFRTPLELRGQDPEKMFADLCKLRGQQLDRCVLYSFRCAVYAASTKKTKPELLKWWNWKNKSLTSKEQ